MIRNLILVLSLVAAISTSGIPMALVQVGAWVNMFDEFYEKTESVLTSAKWTLDGNHRCQGCEFVSEQESEKEKKTPPPEASKVKFELALEMPTIGISHPREMPVCLAESLRFYSAFIQIELPPPRIAS
jgi:hypothetical protein